MKRMSKDSAVVLHALYSQYLSRRKVGQSKCEARNFGSAESIQIDLISNMALEDVEDSMRELDRNDYLINDYGDDTVLQCYLTDSAIVDCENAVSDKIISLADFLSKIIP